MKQTFYMIRNDSKSEGTYLIDNEYKTIHPGQEISLPKPPVNKTVNVTLIMYKREVGESPILYKKPKKTKE